MRTQRQDKIDAGPRARVRVDQSATDDESTLSADAVLNRITNTYLIGVQRCYRDHLKVDGSARGKLALRFTVNESGRAVRNHVSGMAPELHACVAARMDNWRFPAPKDGDGQPTDASFRLSLMLVPD